MPESIERLIFDFRTENREFAPHLVEGSERTVTGYAIVFNQESRVLVDKASRKSFVEKIEPRAVSVDFLNAQDIKLNFNHDNGRLLARSLFGSGTLKFEIDDYGVRFEAELPNTTDGNDVLELIRRGDVWGCSFAFQYAKDGVTDEKRGGRNIRTVCKFAAIHDFAIVVDPAYWGTMVVSSRSFDVQDEPATQARMLAADEEFMLSLENI